MGKRARKRKQLAMRMVMNDKITCEWCTKSCTNAAFQTVVDHCTSQHCPHADEGGGVISKAIAKVLQFTRPRTFTPAELATQPASTVEKPRVKLVYVEQLPAIRVLIERSRVV